MSEVRGLLGELEQILDPALLSRDEGDLAGHSHDWSPGALLSERSGKGSELPLCVVRPTSTQEVSLLLEWADRNRTPVVPFGEGSGVVDGIRPGGAIVVDLGDMWRMIDLDTRSMLVTVQAGVTGPQLAGALAEQNLMLGHEPQSHDISTVGGWVATRACGQLSARYGGIEDLVAGLEAVLPGGRIVRSKVVPRRAAGPDLTSLLLGSEGTLGIVTEVTLRVSEIPSEKADLCIRYDHMADGVTACRALAQSDLRPTVVRLYDADDAALFLRGHPDEAPGPLLILSFDGPGSVDRADVALDTLGGTEGNHDLVAHWWEHRNRAVEEFRELLAGRGLLGAHGIVDTIEVSATWTHLRDLYHSMKGALAPEADFVGCHLSHVYPDGACLYFSLGSAAASDEEARRRLDTWWEVGMRTCLDAGGSISHHHGIGRRKAPWLEEELGGWYLVLKAVKGAIDPNSIMNPGALGL